MERVPKPKDFNFAKTEEEILEFWKEIDAFGTSLKLSEGKPKYTFYDGPPFATGLPHYGHILAGTIKDTITRYYHQKGHHITRRFGWDCHGLPIEFEIEKDLGIKTKEQVLEYGIANYNAACRSIVMKYSEEWKRVVTRLGRWIDMENNYKTMDKNFMESVWWVFKQLWEKGYVYRGVKVLPFSTGCTTVLSNFEAGMNYKTVPDPELYVAFQSADDPNLNYLAWTTTPWTLPSNLCLAVHPDLTYVRVRDTTTNVEYVLMESRLSAVYPGAGAKPKKGKPAPPLPYEVLEKYTGAQLNGRKYVPLFDYFAKTGEYPQAFRIITATYIKDDSGTGIVHQAPGFGDDDHKAAVHAGVIEKSGPIPCPVDESGRFLPPVTDFLGTYVKDADKQIIATLKDQGRVFRQGTITHQYPFCWRSEQPLIYKAVPCWFVRVEQVKEKLLENNMKTYWVPEFVQTKKFHNWLADAHDWAVSRSRYWGTPLPIWSNEDFSEIVVIGSVEELHQKSGVLVEDLHRDFIDHIEIPSAHEGNPPLKRIEDVFDCWFESGSMPYAQQHYPFSMSQEEFESSFPADFIAEGIDQTRGWFYTLLVLSTMLFDKPPFQNLIVNGLVLTEDGKKMSKRLKNYPDPSLVIDRYGSDALRMYLINSPVVRGENLCFKEAGVYGIVRDMLLPWYNNLRFLVQHVQEYESRTGLKFAPELGQAAQSENIVDQWIVAATRKLIAFINQEMSAYRLYTVLPKLVAFIEELNNWFVRLNRRRFRGNFGEEDCLIALNTLFETLLTITRAMAPFTPFFTEYLYQRLRKVLPSTDSNQFPESIHFMEYPKVDDAQSPNMEIVDVVSVMQSVIELGRLMRERRHLPHRQPLTEVLISLKNPSYQALLEGPLKEYLLEELNVAKFGFISEDSDMLQLSAAPNFSLLGKRLVKDLKPVIAAIRKLTQEQLREYMQAGEIEVLGHKISGEELVVNCTFLVDANTYEASSQADLGVHPNVSILLNVRLTDELLQQGIVRHVVHQIQQMRKECGVLVTDPQEIFYFAPDDSPLKKLLDENREVISGRISRAFTPGDLKPADLHVYGQSEYTVTGNELEGYQNQSVRLEVVRPLSSN